MRNLKKILALVLAMVMTFSVMATANAFTDDADINETYAESVEALTNLGVIKGRDTGDFDPLATITRAEVAAIIYRVVTGDVKDESAALYSDYVSFSDVEADDWFAGYVGFCANGKYIKGYPNGTFNPMGKVTGYEALAMILRAIGYDKNNEFTGASWAVETATIAEDKGVTANIIPGTLGVAASREAVAEMIFRALITKQVEYTLAFGYQEHNKNTLGYDTFELTKVTGVVTANEYAALDGTAKNTDNLAKAGKTVVGGTTYTLSTGVDVLGEKVYFYAAGKTAVTSPVSLATVETKYSDTALTAKVIDAIDDGAVIYNNYGLASSINNGKGIAVKAIDNDKDGDFEYILTEEKMLSDVLYVSTTGVVTLDGVDSASKQVTYDGIATGDVVLTITYGGRTYIELAEVVTGNIYTYTTTSSTGAATATINDEQYEVSGVDYKFPKSKVLYVFDSVTDTFTRVHNNTTWNYYLDAFGNIRAYAKATESETSYGLVLAYDMYRTGAFAGEWYVKYLTVDNTVETKIVDETTARLGVGNVGEVVKYRLNAADEFVAVDDLTDINADVRIDAEADKAYIDYPGYSRADETYNVTADLIAFYYEDAGTGYEALYGVLTGADAIADLEVEKDLREIEVVDTGDKVHTNMYDTLAVVNIDGHISVGKQYAYIFTDTVVATTSIEDQTYYTFDAIDAKGNPIDVVVRESYYNMVYGSENPVWTYVTKTVNTVNAWGIETTEVIHQIESVANVWEGDLHADQTDADTIFVYQTNDASGKTLVAPETIALAETTAGGTTTLRADFCSAGYVVFEWIDGDWTAVAVFVEEPWDTYPTFVDVTVEGRLRHLQVGKTFRVGTGAEYKGGTYTWNCSNHNHTTPSNISYNSTKNECYITVAACMDKCVVTLVKAPAPIDAAITQVKGYDVTSNAYYPGTFSVTLPKDSVETMFVNADLTFVGTYAQKAELIVLDNDCDPVMNSDGTYKLATEKVAATVETEKGNSSWIGVLLTEKNGETKTTEVVWIQVVEGY